MQFLKKFFKSSIPCTAPKKRSVVFYRHSYYHFYYLAKALRKRGWDAIVVNLEPPDGINANFYHGEDMNLYDDDPVRFNKNIKNFFQEAKSKYRLMHFAGDGYLSFFPGNTTSNEPSDIIEWKQAGNKVAYTISGCNSGISQSSISSWSMADNGLKVCERCIWQNNEEVCSDAKNLRWGKKVSNYCDLIFTETLPALDFMGAKKNTIREPVTTCLDRTIWRSNLSIPHHHWVDKKTEEILIYHAVGNYDTRHSETRNIKGTPFVFEAIERLKAEGYPVKLMFITNQSNEVIKYYQAQADIIVDQLNFGRYGANAREGMMLGKPVICYLNQFEYKEEDKLLSLQECPLVSATEDSVYKELKNLIVNKELRLTIGNASREYALKWHDAEACAERYERIYDELFKETR